MSSLREFSGELGRLVTASLRGVLSVCTGGCASATGIAWPGGRVVTAASRLKREEGLSVGNGSEHRAARLLGFDPGSDLAILRVEGELAGIPWRSAAQPLTLGEIVLALGRASSAVARLGVVGRVGGEWRLPGGARFERFIESDIAPSGGLAGGPLIDAAGELVGVNSVSLARGRLVTLPVESVARIADAITAHGRVRRARLGVSVQRVDLPSATATEVGRKAALIVLGVQPKSAAEAAGVGLGDVLLELGGVALESSEDLQSALDGDGVQRPLPLEVLRAGRRTTLEVVLSPAD